ncbi:MAG TPA: hypothetical protein VFL95_01500, partial [Gemmatimonadales bacterium]|nr:hypothetical protein [Gemmatimonadales bacterium]
MSTIRRRLTVWYTVALVATLVTFAAAAIWQLEKPSIPELDQRTEIEARFAVKWLQDSYRVLGPLVSNVPGDQMPVLN